MQNAPGRALWVSAGVISSGYIHFYFYTEVTHESFN